MTWHITINPNSCQLSIYKMASQSAHLKELGLLTTQLKNDTLSPTAGSVFSEIVLLVREQI